LLSSAVACAILKLGLLLRKAIDEGDAAMNFAWAVIVASHFVVTVEDRVPTLNIDSVCKAKSLQAQKDTERCTQDEQKARDVLRKEWTQFTGAEKVRCLGTATTSGIASYVELLTCLEIARDVRNLPRKN
jgi:hypothetical protein